MTKSYANKSNAARAAKAAGHTAFNLVQTEDGWHFELPVVARKRGGPRTKFSTVAKPCTVVREFVAANPTMQRKDVLAQLVAMGVDRTTASIQYHKARKG